jgi:hypothetical protein
LRTGIATGKICSSSRPYGIDFDCFTSGRETGIKGGMDIAFMEPMVPSDDKGALGDKVLTLVGEANQLAGRVHTDFGWFDW